MYPIFKIKKPRVGLFFYFAGCMGRGGNLDDTESIKKWGTKQFGYLHQQYSFGRLKHEHIGCL